MDQESDKGIETVCPRTRGTTIQGQGNWSIWKKVLFQKSPTTYLFQLFSKIT